MQVQAGSSALTNEQVFTRVYGEVSSGQRVPEIVCLVRPYVNTMGKVRMLDGRLEVRLSDLVASAPVTVREALAWILLSKMFRRQPPRHHALHYKQYMNRREVRRTFHIVRQARGRKYVSGPTGAAYDLEELFELLNAKYFGGMMARPQLGWSRGRARALLGHFDPSHNAIILSRLLDSAAVPRIAVEYVMYHEMLHLRHPVEHRGSRRYVHTREFKHDEALFEGLAEAKLALKRI